MGLREDKKAKDVRRANKVVPGFSAACVPLPKWVFSAVILAY
jgi:hypothetical protein